MASIGVDKLDAYQNIPFGTPAHDKSYGRRNPSEKTISMIKDKGGLTPESVPGVRSRRSHHRSPGTGHRSQPQTNPQS